MPSAVLYSTRTWRPPFPRPVAVAGQEDDLGGGLGVHEDLDHLEEHRRVPETRAAVRLWGL